MIFFENFKFRKKNVVEIEAKIMKSFIFSEKNAKELTFCIVIELYMLFAYICCGIVHIVDVSHKFWFFKKMT